MDKYAAQHIQSIWTKVLNKNRNCMFGSCVQKAIKSHVLQKNGILNQIAVDNHLIHLDQPNVFDAIQGKIHRPKRVGVNNVHTFTGFCNEHDTKIFAQIEATQNLDLYNTLTQALFSYRALCQEIRRKNDVKEHQTSAIGFYPKESRHLISAMIDGTNSAITNLGAAKDALESAISKLDFSQYTFFTVPIPKIDLCLSAPLNLHKPEAPHPTYEEYKKHKPLFFPTSFLNVFPYKDSSYVIAGYHNDWPCHWTNRFIEKIKLADRAKLFKEISDLIVLRLEFWAMSPTLFEKIPLEKIEQYKIVFTQHIYSHDEELHTELNLFENL